MSEREERPVVRIPVRGRAAGDLDAEFAFHLEMRTRELIAKGLDPESARAEAQRQFGDLDGARAYCREVDQQRESRMFRREFFSGAAQDLRYAVRALIKAPGFAAIAMLTLALGIGATTSIFSVVSGILLRPLPFENPQALMIISSTYDGRQSTSSPANIADFRSQNTSFSSIATLESDPAILTEVGEPVRLSGYSVSADFFPMLGIKPVIGRIAFTPEEGSWKGPKAVVLRESLWQSRFGGDTAVVGRMIALDGERYQVIGVAPSASSWPTGAQIWRPFSYDPADLASSRGAVYLSMVGRLKPGVSVDAAASDMRRIGEGLAAQYPDNDKGMSATVTPMHEWIAGDLRRPLLILLGGVAFVLLIACANVANLQLVRGVTRETELAVRAALGAARGRLVRQLVTESVLLSLAGGAVGFALASFGTKALVAMAPAGIPRLREVHVDATVLAFAVLIAVATGVVFGLVPARQLLRADLSAGLREGTRGSQRVATNRARRGLVVAEIALSVMLIAGAGLLIRSFNRLMDVDPGFQTKSAMSFALSLPAASYPTPQSQLQMTEQLLQRLNALPGVDTAGAALGMPLTQYSFGFSFTVAGRPVDPADEPAAEVRLATPSYFAAMGIPIVKGRGFSETDRAGSAGALLIAEAAAKEFFPNEDPIGKHITFGWSRDEKHLEGDIVGIVADVKQSTLADATRPQFWAPMAQWPVSSFNVVMRTSGEPRSVAAAARSIVHELDRNLPVNSERTLTEVIAASVAQPRFYMTLLSVFSAVALLLSAIGVYGVIAFLTGQREREIGIRVALGASRASIASLVLRESALMVGGGIVIGVAGALALTQVMRKLLFGIQPTDVPTYLIVIALLSIVAIAASVVPAIGALRVDPVRAMRAE